MPIKYKIYGLKYLFYHLFLVVGCSVYFLYLLTVISIHNLLKIGFMSLMKYSYFLRLLFSRFRLWYEMGVRGLWTLLNPVQEHVPLRNLGGQKLAIDLSGWVCGDISVNQRAHTNAKLHLRYLIINIYHNRGYCHFIRFCFIF